MVQERFPRAPQPSLPQEAPWREIESLIDGLKDVSAKLDALITALGGAPPAGVGAPPAAPIEIKTQPLSTIVPETLIFQRIFSQLPANSEILDFTKGYTLLIKVESTLNQLVTIQVLGNIRNAVDKSATLGPAIALPASGNSTIIIAQAFWHPYIWLSVTLGIAPTQGDLRAWYTIHG